MATLKPEVEKVAKPKDDTVKGILGLGPMVVPYNTDASEISTACPSLYYGVELEIENAANYLNWNIKGIDFKEDNSLRNNGIEIVTAPMKLNVLNHTLKTLFAIAKLSDLNYSERCSTHIHANCRDITLEQVASVALLYQVFEHLLFMYVGAERDKNIFCVPWHETKLNFNIVNLLSKNNGSRIKQWQKYTALNLLPLWDIGTIEFRHMPGTCNQDFIINWCNLIGCLFEHAKTYSLEEIKNSIISLNSTSAYRVTLERIFKQWADFLKFPLYETLLEEGVLMMKYTLIDNKKVEKSSLRDILNDFVIPEPPGHPLRAPFRWEQAIINDIEQNDIIEGTWTVTRT